MSFYDEVKREYKSDFDKETGLPKQERKTLDNLIENCKSNILAATKRGNIHVVLKYKSSQRRFYAEEPCMEGEFYCLLDNCMNDPNYISAWEVLIDSLGSEFDIEISFAYDTATVYIQWESPEIEETT